MKNFYLIKTKPHQEVIATQNLTKQGFNVFFPKAVIKNKITSLFPGYLFIELDDKTQNWTLVRSTRGVSDFVRFGLSFAKVPNQIINLIRVQQQQTIEKMINICSHHKGDHLEIKTGSFKGQQAIFQNYNSSHRVTVLLELIGQQQAVTFDQKEVVAV
jgi:transcriptional antiterminator RfaH